MATFPDRLNEDFKLPPKLSHEQCGHIRHIHNLASQIDGEWALMASEEPGQEWDFARRYQLGHMAYAAGAAHYHHLPAMRSMFKTLLERLIKKMLLKEVWDYWYLSSQSGIKLDPDLKELRKPWADPVCKENIMYSGHLLLMISLYTMLFQDQKYDEKDSILFDWNPVFFGMGRETYSYTRMSLQEAILKEMEREKWMGILAFRYNDAVNETHIVDEVLEKYKAAWARHGFIGENGLFRRNYYPNQAKFVANEEVNHTTWAMAFMPWNYEMTEPLYPSIANGFLEKIDDRTNIRPSPIAHAIRGIVAKEGGNHDDPSVIARARENVKEQDIAKKRFDAPTFGHVALWVSEYGSTSDTDSLLRHADAYLNPSWREGGLYYRRHDTTWDEQGNYTKVDPVTGNSAIAYARLNVRHGQKKMWDEPWTKERLESLPYLDGVGLDQGVDCLRGCWDEDRKAMIATFRSWNDSHVSIKPTVKNMPAGTYGIYVNGCLKDLAEISGAGSEIAMELEVAGEEVDLVVLLDHVT